MTSVTHIPRLTGGDAGITAISTPKKRKDCSSERCAHQDRLRAAMGGRSTGDATRGADA